MTRLLKTRLACAVSAAALITTALSFESLAASTKHFNRVATFHAFENTNIDDEATAEIVAASADGMTLIYTDSIGGRIGFVDITRPSAPAPLGVVVMGGEPTSVAVKDGYALVAVDSSDTFEVPTGHLHIVDIASRTIVRTIDLGGQPDSIAVSPDKMYAAIAIENQRDEDVNDGAIPQAPAGNLTIVDLAGAVGAWATRTVDLTGIADIAPEDPEPEYVSINTANMAVVTLQENNHLVIVDLATGNVTANFSAGSNSLDRIDSVEEDVISFDGSITDLNREPDGVAWLDETHFAIANEGDWQGGTRGFTIFNTSGDITYDSGRELEMKAAFVGHYPEDRAENKGVEAENVAYGDYGGDRFLFVNMERADLTAVYKLDANNNPSFEQVLPASVEPEGALTIPSRNLFVSASEGEDRGAKFRGSLNIYERQQSLAEYPTLSSAKDDDTKSPIPFAALSGLAVDPADETVLYSVTDSLYANARILKINLDTRSYRKYLEAEIPVTENGAQATLDLEGIAVSHDGGFWLASEGNASTTENMLIHTDAEGAIQEKVVLPETIAARATSNGFEGVAAVMEAIPGEGTREILYVAFQRTWKNDPANHVRIGRYDPSTKEWTFAWYVIDAPTSPAGGWVGLSEISWAGNNTLAVIERDNQGNADARIKYITQFSLDGVTFKPDITDGTTEPEFDTVVKSLVRDTIAKRDFSRTGGYTLEKIEGLAVLSNGDVYMVNDNDGGDDSNGETQLMRFLKLFVPFN